MKRGFFSIIFASVLMLSLLAGCKKDETEQPSPITINEKSFATVSGLVYAQLDYTNADPEFAPAGTKLIFKIDVSDYNSNEGSGQRYYITSTTVGSDGSYSIDIPTTTKGVDVEVIANEFTYMTKYSSTFTERSEYSANTSYLNLTTGEIQILDINYN